MVRMRLAAAMVALACAASAARGGTLSTRFSMVQCDDVPYNATIAPRLPDGTGYELRNDSDAPIVVAVRSLSPTFCEPVPGRKPFRPLPTNCVVRIKPARLEIPPHAAVEAMVTIEMPDDPALEGGRFETWIRSEAIRGTFGVALVSRVRITVGKRAHAEEAEKESHAEGAEDESHAESAKGAEDDSHAESAEGAEDESHAKGVKGAATEPAEGAVE